MPSFPLTVNGPQGASYAAPLVDFSPIGNLFNSYTQGTRNKAEIDLRNAFRDGLPMTAEGVPDYSKIARTIAMMGGSVDQALNAAKNIVPQQIQQQALRDLQDTGGGMGMSGGGGVPVAPAGDTTGTAPTAPRGIRNNNPGNIKDGPFAKSQPGYVGADPGGFAKFASIEDGQRAAEANLNSYGSKGVVTPNSIAARWAPKGDGNNDPTAYGAFIAKELDVDADAPLDLSDPAVRTKVAGAIGKFENGPKAFAAAGSASPGANTPSTAPAAPSITKPSSTALTDPTISGLVPKSWISNGKTAGEYVDFLFKKGQAYAALGQAKAAEAYFKRADTVAGALQKAAEPTPDLKNYEAYRAQEIAGGRQPLPFEVFKNMPADLKEFLFAKANGFGGKLEDWLARKRAGAGEYGLQPIYGVDKDGNPVIMQLGKSGTATQAQIPGGVRISKEPIRIDAGTSVVLIDPITRQPIATVPKNVAEAAAEREAGTERGKAQMALPAAIASGEQALQTIQQLRTHPGRYYATGAFGVLPGVPGTEQRGFVALYNQAKGQTFLQAYQSLRGGGAITEVEGQKAEQAIARLDRAQSDKDFDKALSNLESIIKIGMENAKKKAGGRGPAAASTTSPTLAPVRISSPEDRDALAPGTRYIAPDGNVRIKQ